MSLPPELMRACRESRLLVVWGDLPFALLERPPANRALAIERLPAAPALSSRLSDLPPLPILSLDASERIERAFAEAGVALQVVRTRRDVPARDRHALIELAGDVSARSGVVLSRAEVRDLRGDEDKRGMLDEARRIAAGGAVLLVGCDPANDDFKAWWSTLAPVFEGAVWLAVGYPSAPWPQGVTCVDTDFDAVRAALQETQPAATEKTAAEVATSVKSVSGGVTVQSASTQVGGDVVGRDKFESAGGHIVHAGPGATVIIGGAHPAAKPAPQDDAETASLRRQLAEAEANLQLIRERKSQYVLEVDVPLQLVKEERHLVERIGELKARLADD